MTAVEELTRLDAAVENGSARLLELQHPGGWWVGELESNATMIAEHLFWLHVLGLRDPDTDRRLANDLLARCRDDGTWSNWWEGPADLSTTIESYVALKMAGVEPGRETLDYIRREGGISRSRVFTKCFMALLGHWPWQRVTPIPPELILLPPSAPFSIYNFACWARQTVVPLSVVWALRPVRHADVDLREIGARPGETKRPPRPTSLRRRALAAAEAWVKERQEADGSWGGIQPPWVWSIVMLAALGRGFEDETLRRAVEGWGTFMIEDGDRLRPEACQSPIWDTGLAVIALRAAGIAADHPQLRKAGEWLLQEEVTVKGDWSIRSPDLAPGGWAFEFENDLYPDVDDTAVVAIALRELGMGEEAVRRGLDWIEGMQSANGGWGAFDVDNSSHWLYKLPFCDFGYVIDPPSEDVSAHALEALAPEPRYAETVARGLEYLVDEQQRGRLLVGPLGREPRLRHRGGVAGAGSLWFGAEASGGREGRELAGFGPARGRRLRGGHSLLPPDDHARPRRSHCFTNSVGVTRLRRGRRSAESLGVKSGRLSLREAGGERRLE